MNNLSDLYKKMKEPLTPGARVLVERIKSKPDSLVKRSFVAPSNQLEVFNNDSAYFEFTFVEDGQPVVFKENWSPQIESEFYRLNIVMDTPVEEAIRGAYLLLSNMQFPDIEFGNGFTDSVVWEVISERFKGIPVVASLLEQIPHNNPKSSVSFSSCYEYVKSAVNGYGNSLVMQLKYSDKEAFPVLVASVVYFLDRRFSISLKKAIFRQD